MSKTNTLSLLFVPGLSMPAWIFDKQLDYFSKNYNVVAMDPRSQGSSSQTTEGQFALGRASELQSLPIGNIGRLKIVKLYSYRFTYHL